MSAVNCRVSVFQRTWIVFALFSALNAEAQNKRVLLAEHETIAVLESIEYRLCRGLTALCPDRCGDSGEVATFAIVKYTWFVKHGEYGKQQTVFHVQVNDYHKNPLNAPQTTRVARALTNGDYVRLCWNHVYVSLDGASYPERPVVKIEKMDSEELEEFLASHAAAEVDDSTKIEFDLAQLDVDGLRGEGSGKVALSYEFKIPDERREEVFAIDSSLQFSHESRGRVDAGEGETLCIGSTHQTNFRAVLHELTALPYVDRIIECHFE